MVGTVARMRLSSVTAKLLSSGTLKSTRISARLPLKLMSLIVFIRESERLSVSLVSLVSGLVSKGNSKSFCGLHHIGIFINKIVVFCGLFKGNGSNCIVFQSHHLP